MKITQLSVFLENKPGRLQHILQVLADKGINILTLTIAEVTDFGILRLILDKPEEAFLALRSEQITCTRTDVMAVVIEDQPGALFQLIEAFTRRQINIEYMYAFLGRHGSRPTMVFRFEDLALAQEALQQEGYTLLPRAEIQGA
jgi:hypothetical protein